MLRSLKNERQGEVASNSDEVDTEEEKKEEVFQLKRTRTGKFLEIMNPCLKSNQRRDHQ